MDNTNPTSGNTNPADNQNPVNPVNPQQPDIEAKPADANPPAEEAKSLVEEVANQSETPAADENPQPAAVEKEATPPIAEAAEAETPPINIDEIPSQPATPAEEVKPAEEEIPQQPIEAEATPRENVAEIPATEAEAIPESQPVEETPQPVDEKVKPAEEIPQTQPVENPTPVAAETTPPQPETPVAEAIPTPPPATKTPADLKPGDKVNPTPETVLKKTNPQPKTGMKADGNPLDGEEKIFAAIGYIGILALVPLLAKRNSEFCQHHGKQSLVVAVLFVFLWLLAKFSYSLAVLVFILQVVAIIGGFLLAFKGDWFRIPGIYNLSLKLDFAKKMEKKEENQTPPTPPAETPPQN